MNLGVAAYTGLREIQANKFRSILSFAAISVGIASLLFTLAQGRGMREQTRKSIELMGPGRIEVTAKENYQSKGVSPGLTYEDAVAIREQMPELHMVYPKKRIWQQAVWVDGKKHDLMLNAIAPEWRKRDWVYKVRGRFFNEWDMAHAARACVIIEPGGWIKKPFWARFWMSDSEWDTLVTHRDMLGKIVTINGKVLTVVGVLESPPRDKDPRWNFWDQPNILVPFTTYSAALADGRQGGPKHADSIQIDAGSEAGLLAAKRRVERILQSRHREPDFEVKDQREEMEGELEEARKILVAFLTLGSVALFAGGIGIMNVTFATIFSRVKEIGIRRALGAERTDIMAQFVLEALLLGLAGGVVGVCLGKAAIDYLARTTDRDIALLSWHHVVQALGMAGLISGGFAFYPAYQASKLDPVEALRSE